MDTEVTNLRSLDDWKTDEELYSFDGDASTRGPELVEEATEGEDALRYNTGKPPLSHILDYPHAMAALAEVAEYGANKYERGNFSKGQYATITADCLMRHLMKWWAGEDMDDESGLHHLSHVLWNVCTLIQDASYPDRDDRPPIAPGAVDVLNKTNKG